MLSSNADIIYLVPILDGASEISAHVRMNLCHLIWFMHLTRSKSQIEHFSPKRHISLHAWATYSELPCEIYMWMLAAAENKMADLRFAEFSDLVVPN